MRGLAAGGCGGSVQGDDVRHHVAARCSARRPPCADSRALRVQRASRSAARMPMTMITISSSMSVKPCCRAFACAMRSPLKPPQRRFAVAFTSRTPSALLGSSAEKPLHTMELVIREGYPRASGSRASTVAPRSTSRRSAARLSGEHTEHTTPHPGGTTCHPGSTRISASATTPARRWSSTRASSAASST